MYICILLFLHLITKYYADLNFLAHGGCGSFCALLTGLEASSQLIINGLASSQANSSRPK